MTLERAARYSFIVLVACAFVAACGGEEPAKPVADVPTKPAADAPAKPAVKLKGREQAPEPTIEELLKARVELPDYYPDDAPVYPGATANRVNWVRGRVNAVFTTDDDPSDASGTLQSALDSSGWEEIVVAEMVNGVVLQAGKDERSISALVSRMQEGTRDEVTMIMVVVDP
jgi:hypothetical protein